MNVHDTSTDNNIDHSYEKFVFSRASVVITQKNTGLDREIGRVFAEYKDSIVIIAGENKKEHEYLIPKSRVNYFDGKQIYLDISENSLNDFEF
jgi:hypothetical protein